MLIKKKSVIINDTFLSSELFSVAWYSDISFPDTFWEKSAIFI